MTMTKLLVLALVAASAASCGDNKSGLDARPRDADSDAGFPRAPSLGPQIERMGRPAINTALNAAFFDSGAAATAKKDAYNLASDPAAWAGASLGGGRTIAAELATNLSIIDVLDQANAGIPEPPTRGCGNQVLHNGNPGGGGTPVAGSYLPLAGILADDMLYVDTSKASCLLFMSLEVEAATGGAVPHTQCGGRTPTHDVIDTSYSVLAAGLAGFTNPGFVPRIGDGVTAHADVSDSVFPFLGPPH